jgi:hypothetical protein
MANDTKANVRRLNHGVPGWAFLGADENTGFGEIFDAIITTLNKAVDADLSGSDAASIAAALLADKTVIDKAASIAKNGCLSSAGLAIGSSDPAKAKVVNTTTYRVNGQIYTTTAAEVALTGAAYGGAAVTARGWYVLVDNAGTLSVSASANATGVNEAAAKAAVVWPALPANASVLGAVVVATDGAHAFTPGTTHLDATGMTTTYYNGIPEAAGAIAAADDGTGVTAIGSVFSSGDDVPELV